MDLASVFESYGRVANAPILASIGSKFKSSCRLCGADPAIQPVTMMDDSNRFCETCVEQTREEVIAQAIQNNPSLARVMVIASSEEVRQSLCASEVRSGLALASALTNASEFLVTQGDGSLQARAHCGLAYVEIDTLKPVIEAMSQLLPSIAGEVGKALTQVETIQWAAIVGVLMRVLQSFDGKTVDLVAFPTMLMRNLQVTLRTEYSFNTAHDAFFFPQDASDAEARELMSLLNTLVNFLVENARQRVLWRAEAEAQTEKAAASAPKSSESETSKGWRVRWMK